MPTLAHHAPFRTGNIGLGSLLEVTTSNQGQEASSDSALRPELSAFSLLAVLSSSGTVKQKEGRAGQRREGM